MLQPLAAKRDISLIYRFAKDEWYERLSFGSSGKPVFVIGDWLRLQQLLTNLVTNSIKYSQPGTQIMVTCHFGIDENCYNEIEKSSKNSSDQEKKVQIRLTIEDQGLFVRFLILFDDWF